MPGARRLRPLRRDEDSRRLMQTMPTDARESTQWHRRIALAAFLVLSAFMYVSIIYKIINYGP